MSGSYIFPDVLTASAEWYDVVQRYAHPIFASRLFVNHTTTKVANPTMSVKDLSVVDFLPTSHNGPAPGRIVALSHIRYLLKN